MRAGASVYALIRILPTNGTDLDAFAMCIIL
jgi:hypothetical protein